MAAASITTITDFARRLAEARIHYEVRHNRDDAISFAVTVPGERWEIDFLADGDVEVEIFRSDGQILGAGAIPDLLARFSDERP